MNNLNISEIFMGNFFELMNAQLTTGMNFIGKILLRNGKCDHTLDTATIQIDSMSSLIESLS